MNVKYSEQEMPLELHSPKAFKESGIEFGEGGIHEDLDGVLKDASVNNLTWLEDDFSFEPNSKDFDTKDDLELQWNYNDIGPMDYENSPELNKMPTPCDSTLDIVQKTREFLNQGMGKDEIFAKINKAFGNKALSAAKKAWIENKTDKIAGIVGRIAIDVRGYSNPRLALKHASVSPYKKLIKYVIGCTGDKEFRTKDVSSLIASDIKSSGNSINDFFDNSIKASKMQMFSKDLMLPVLAHSFDLDDSEADETLVQLANMGYMAEEEIENIKKEAKTAYSKVKKAFLFIDQKKKAKSASLYKEKVSNKDFIIKKAENTINLSAKAKAGVDIADISLPKPEEVSFKDGDDLGKVEIKGKEMDIKLNNKAKNSDVLDVEPECFQEEEFKGIDSFDLNDEKKSEGILDIDGNSDFSF